MRLALIVILVVLIASAVVLVGTMPNLYLLANRSLQSARELTADAVASELERTDHVDLANLEDLRDRFQLSSIGARHLGSGTRVETPPRAKHERTLVRPVAGWVYEIRFGADDVSDAAQLLRVAATAGGVTAAAAILLLGLHLFDLFTRAGLAKKDATTPEHGETAYIVETFGSSIRTLQGRETELRELHAREQERADELAAVSSTLVRSLTSGFIALDEQGRIVDLNDAARDLLSLGADRPAQGLALRDALGDSEFARTVEGSVAERKALQRHEVVEGSRVIGLTTVPLLDPRGRSFGTLVLFTDLTEVRKLETRVREMQAIVDIGEMSAGVAHEFRNSLSTILGYLKLSQKHALPDAARLNVRHAEQEAVALSTAVDALLNFAKPMHLESGEVDLFALVNAEVDQLRAGAEGVALEVRGGPAKIEGDPRLLARAVQNVLRNAVDAVREKKEPGRVTVDVSADPVASIVVSDTGVGLDPQESARLVLPFQSTKANGFGLGLALTNKIVLLHGGEMTLDGEKGRGATVTLRFPGDGRFEQQLQRTH